ncbi:MAG: hypothetical protein ACK5JF_00170 [Oscillospiraceae bacterium]
MEDYKDRICKVELDYFFVYAIKVFYSLELTSLFYEAVVNKSAEENEKKADKYLQLVNVQIMPQRFQYYNYRGKKIENEDIVKYVNDWSENFDELMKKIVGSEVSVSGDVRVGIQKATIPFKYRYLYNEEEVELISNTSYFFDPYVIFGKRVYFNDVVSVYSRINDCKTRLPYIFISMFHIDMFVRITYSSKRAIEGSRKETIYSVAMGAMERFLTSTFSSERRENRLLQQMSEYFGTYFGLQDENEEATRIFYDFPYKEDTRQVFNDINILTEESNEVAIETDSLDELIEEVFNKIKNKRVILPYLKALSKYPHLSSADQDEVKMIQERLAVSGAQYKQKYKSIIADLMWKYFWNK